jgi:hypothetical protein
MDLSSILFRVETDIYPNLFIKLQNSSGLCWRHGESKKSGEENIQELERPSRKQRGRVWSLWNRCNLSAGFYFVRFGRESLHSVYYVFLSFHCFERKEKRIQDAKFVDYCTSSIHRL